MGKISAYIIEAKYGGFYHVVGFFYGEEEKIELVKERVRDYLEALGINVESIVLREAFENMLTLIDVKIEARTSAVIW